MADTLSRIPGAESLPLHLLCSHVYTLGSCNLDDTCCDDTHDDVALHGIISIFENSSFLK